MAIIFFCLVLLLGVVLFHVLLFAAFGWVIGLMCLAASACSTYAVFHVYGWPDPRQ